MPTITKEQVTALQAYAATSSKEIAAHKESKKPKDMNTMKMKFIDGLSLHESNVCSVQNTITALFSALHTVPSGTIHVTDAHGHYIERAKLFEETLSDGSKAYTIELHFSS